MDPLTILLEVVMEALKAAVPEVAGRVYPERAIPRQRKDSPWLQVSVGDEQIERRDAAPPTNRRVRTFVITAVASGDTDEAYRMVLLVRYRVLAIMREIQFIPAAEEKAACIIDEIAQTGDSGIEIASDGDRQYAGISLTYEATYLTDEGARGESGPGIPSRNVLEIFRAVLAKWDARRGSEQRLGGTDYLSMETENGDNSDNQGD